jgi:hypothetical protein
MVAKAIVQEVPEDSSSVDFEAVVLTKDGQEATSKAPRSLSLQQPLAVEAMPDVPFSHLCNRGFAITRTNWLVKLWRYFIVPTKELYLPFMTNKMPTNFLMVSNSSTYTGHHHKLWHQLCLLGRLCCHTRGRDCTQHTNRWHTSSLSCQALEHLSRPVCAERAHCDADSELTACKLWCAYVV